MLQKTELLIVINFLVDCMLVSFKDPHSYSKILKKKKIRAEETFEIQLFETFIDFACAPCEMCRLLYYLGFEL